MPPGNQGHDTTPTGQLNSIVLLALQNIQQRIDKSGLSFGLDTG
jgi:hypothetical protein